MIFRVLPGLPSHGEMAVNFPEAWKGREGVVVEFGAGHGSWVGNFCGGRGGLCGAWLRPDGHHVLVVSEGKGWVVDPIERSASEWVDQLAAIWPVEEPVGYVMQIDDMGFAHIGINGETWRTETIGYDGFTDLRLRSAELTSTSSSDGRRRPLRVDLQTGRVSASHAGRLTADLKAWLTSRWNGRP